MTTDAVQGLAGASLRREWPGSGMSGWPQGSSRGRSGSWQRSWQWATGRGSDLRRLDWEIERLHYRLAYRQAIEPAVEADSPTGPAGSAAHVALTQAVEAANAARDACDARNSEKGWGLFAQAAEFEVLCMCRDEVDAMRDSLTSEVDRDPDAGWWREAALELLGSMSRDPSRPVGAARTSRPPGKGAAGTPRPPAKGSARSARAASTTTPRARLVTAPVGDRERATELTRDRLLLREALRKRNESLSLRYSAMAADARDRIWLAILLIGLLTLAGLIIRRHAGEQVASLDASWIAGTAAVAGAIGSVTSAMQRLCSTPKAQVATRLQSFTVIVIQVLIGTVAALTVYIGSAAGIVPIEGDHKVFLLALAAFGSGFTERLVVYKPTRSR